jgi:hypothetical protein
MKMSLRSGIGFVELIELLFQWDVSPVYMCSSSADRAAENYCHLTSRINMPAESSAVQGFHPTELEFQHNNIVLQPYLSHGLPLDLINLLAYM